MLQLNNIQRKSAALTLVELLVTIAVFGVALTAVTSFFVSSNRTAIYSRDKATTLREGQVVQQILTARMAEAIYFWPGNESLQLTINGATTKNTIGGNTQTWQVNKDPFIAMVLPPRDPAKVCASSNTAGCYRFYAYYAVRRDDLANDPSLTVPSKPIVNTKNPDAWVLMQYNANLMTWKPDNGFPPAPSDYMGNSGLMLADYIKPDDGSLFSDVVPTDPPKLFYVYPPSDAGKPSTTAEFRYRLEKVTVGPSGNATITVPNNFIGGKVQSRNIRP